MKCVEQGTWPNAYTSTEDLYNQARTLLRMAREARAKAKKIHDFEQRPEIYAKGPLSHFGEGYYRGLARGYRAGAAFIMILVRAERPYLT